MFELQWLVLIFIRLPSEAVAITMNIIIKLFFSLFFMLSDTMRAEETGVERARMKQGELQLVFL